MAETEQKGMTRRERKEAVREAAAAGLNRRDRAALASALKRGDASAMSAAKSKDFKPFGGTSAAVVGEEAAKRNRSGGVSVTGSMREVGTLDAGIQGTLDIDPGAYGLKPGEALLYDDVSGRLYATAKWNDVKHNAAAWVNPEGERFRGYVGKSSKSKADEPVYNLNANIRPFQVAAFGEAPEPGTEEFQKWLGDQFKEGVRQQAAQNRFDPEKGSTGTGFGAYGSITVRDWVELGRPKHVSRDTILFDTIGASYEELSEISDEDLIARAGDESIMTVDQYDRSHGVEKSLNKLGGAFLGDKNFGHEAMRVLSDVGSVPVLGSLISLVTDPINAYEASRDTGKSASGSLREAGKAGIAAANDFYVDTAMSALLAGSVAAAPFTGGASLAFGIAAGAALGAAGAAVKSGVRSTIYGGFDEGNLLNDIGTGAATGAVKGALQGTGKAAAAKGASAGWVKAGKAINSRAAQGAIAAGTRYALLSAKYGGNVSESDILESSLIAGAVSAVGVDGKPVDYVGPYAPGKPGVSAPGDTWNGVWGRFRDVARGRDNWAISWMFGRGPKKPSPPTAAPSRSRSSGGRQIDTDWA